MYAETLGKRQNVARQASLKQGILFGEAVHGHITLIVFLVQGQIFSYRVGEQVLPDLRDHIAGRHPLHDKRLAPVTNLQR